MDFLNYSNEEFLKQAQKMKDELSKNQKHGADNNAHWFNFPLTSKEKVTMRILPVLVPGASITVSHHKKIPGLKEKQSKWLCLKTHHMDCPICQALSETSDRLDHGFNGTNYNPISKIYVNALFVRATDDKNNIITYKDMKGNPYVTKTPYITPLTPSMFKWLVDSFVDHERGDVCHPKTGRNINFVRERDYGPFAMEFAFQSTPIAESDEEMRSIFAKAHNLHEIWRSPDDEFVKKTKELALVMRDVLDQRIRQVGTGFGSKEALAPTATHHQPAPSTPTPAQTLGNPAMVQPPPLAPQPVAAPTPQAPVAPAPAPVAQAPSSAPVAQAMPAAQPAAPKKVVAPPGAPACFSDPNVFNRSSNKCMVCNYDYHCEKAIQSAKQA
jgi:hypothetical protein